MLKKPGPRFGSEPGSKDFTFPEFGSTETLTCSSLKTGAEITEKNLSEDADFLCLFLFSDRNNQRAHDMMIVRQIRRLLKDASDDNDTLKNDIRQNLKRLLLLDSQSEILDLLFHTDYLNLNTIRMFIEEILEDLEKNSHHHNPQESIHLQDFCKNSLNLLEIYTLIEQYRNEHLALLYKNQDLFSKEVKTKKINFYFFIF
jgi:hypothetical protein